jgi:hypothetical protein
MIQLDDRAGGGCYGDGCGGYDDGGGDGGDGCGGIGSVIAIAAAGGGS